MSKLSRIYSFSNTISVYISMMVLSNSWLLRKGTLVLNCCLLNSSCWLEEISSSFCVM